jgi:hypothetical protein
MFVTGVANIRDVVPFLRPHARQRGVLRGIKKERSGKQDWQARTLAAPG